MKFDRIKANAKRLYAEAMNQWDRSSLLGAGPLAKGSYPAFDALLPFIRSSAAEREALREFAEAFEALPGDWLAATAKSATVCQFKAGWSQLVLRAREAGYDLIDRWDVRQVGKLIELMPECVPSRYRGVNLMCYMADDEASTWMVEVA